MAKNQVKKAHGQIRRSQVVTTFGPGAMVDLSDYSILISGLDQWTGVNEEIIEPRLLLKLKEHLDLDSLMTKSDRVLSLCDLCGLVGTVTLAISIGMHTCISNAEIAAPICGLTILERVAISPKFWCDANADKRVYLVRPWNRAATNKQEL